MTEVFLSSTDAQGRIAAEFLVDPDGTVCAYDEIAGHYTLHHGFRGQVVARARELASLVWSGTHYNAGGWVWPKGGGPAEAFRL